MISHNDNLSLHHDEEAAASWCMRIAEQRLDLADQAEFEQWISANAHNARLFEQMVAVWQYTNAIAELPGFLALRAKALSAMKQAQASSETAKSPSRRRALAAAAGFALFAVMGHGIGQRGPMSMRRTSVSAVIFNWRMGRECRWMPPAKFPYPSKTNAVRSCLIMAAPNLMSRKIRCGRLR